MAAPEPTHDEATREGPAVPAEWFARVREDLAAASMYSDWCIKRKTPGRDAALRDSISLTSQRAICNLLSVEKRTPFLSTREPQSGGVNALSEIRWCGIG